MHFIYIYFNFIDLIYLHINFNIPPGTHNVSAPAACSACEAEPSASELVP